MNPADSVPLPGNARAAAAAGLEASERHTWRVWQATEEHLRAAEQGLETVDRSAAAGHDLDSHHAVVLARAAAQDLPVQARLAVLREALSLVQSGAASGVNGMAGMALHLAGRLACSDFKDAAEKHLLSAMVDTAKTEGSPEAATLGFLAGVATDPGQALTLALEPLPALDASTAARFALQMEKVGLDKVRPLADPAVALLLDAAEALMKPADQPEALRDKVRTETLRIIADGSAPRLDLARRVVIGDAQTDANVEWALQQAATEVPWVTLQRDIEAQLQNGIGGVELRQEVWRHVAAGETLTFGSLAAVAEPVLKRNPGPAATTALLDRLEKTAGNPTETAVATFLKSSSSDAGPVGLAAGLKAFKPSPDALRDVGLGLLAASPSTAIADRLVAQLAAASPGNATLNWLQGLSGLSSAHHSAVLQAGLSEAGSLAQVALHAAGADPVIADKYRIARSALAAIEKQVIQEENPSRIALVQTLLRMSQIDEVKLQDCPNEGWFWTAASMDVLHVLSRPEGDQKLAVAGLQLMNASWMPDAYLVEMGSRLLDGMKRQAECRGDHRYVPSAVDLLKQKMDAAGTDALARVQVLRQGLQDVRRFESDQWHDALVAALEGQPDPHAPRIERSDESLVIGGVRMSGPAAPASDTPPADPIPVERPAPVAREAASLPLVTQETSVEFQEKYHGGKAGAYNPWTGQVHWEEKYHGGTALVYNPRTHAVVPHEKYHGGVAGVYRPDTGEVQWQEKYHGGICGVWNPATGEAAWQEKYHGGVRGVYNPSTGQLQWQEKYHGDVAGVYLSSTGTVRFDEKYRGGICGVSTDPDGATLNGTGFGMDPDDE